MHRTVAICTYCSKIVQNGPLKRSSMAATPGLGSTPTVGPSSSAQRWTHLAPASAQLGPKMAQSGIKLDPFGGPRTAKFDPSRLLVGPSKSACFLSVLFSGCGRFSPRSDSNKGKQSWIFQQGIQTKSRQEIRAD